MAILEKLKCNEISQLYKIYLLKIKIEGYQVTYLKAPNLVLGSALTLRELKANFKKEASINFSFWAYMLSTDFFLAYMLGIENNLGVITHQS